MNDKYLSLGILLETIAEDHNAFSPVVMGDACYKASKAIGELRNRPDLSTLPDHARLQVEAIIDQYGGGE